MTETRSFNADLRSLLERPGPFISLYMNTEAATEDGPGELQLRWRALRERALEKRADEASLKLLDDFVPGAHRKAAGLCAFVEGSSLVLRRHLSRPIPDEITVGALPHLVPLLDWQQDNPRYAVVTSDRQGADIHVVFGDQVEETETVEGVDGPIQKVQPGGWSQRRFQARAEDTWDQNAKRVAAELARVVSAEDVEFVVVTGDVRALQFLKDNVEAAVAPLLIDLEGTPEVGIDDIRAELEKVAAAHVARRTEALLQRFQEERGQQDLAVEGVQPTFDALRKAQVETLMVSPRRLQGTAWFSASDLTQASTKKAGLTEIGIDDATESGVTDVLVRCAFGTGARVWVVPELSDELAPAEGVGGLLRYA